MYSKHADILFSLVHVPSVVHQTTHLLHHFPEVLPLNLPIRMIIDKLVESFSHLNKSGDSVPTCVQIEMYLRLVHATALHHGIDVLLPQLWLPVVVAHIGIYLFSGQI